VLPLHENEITTDMFLSGMFFFWNVDTTLCSMLNASGKTNQTVLRNHFLKTLDSRQPHRHNAQYVQWFIPLGIVQRYFLYNAG